MALVEKKLMSFCSEDTKRISGAQKLGLKIYSALHFSFVALRQKFSVAVLHEIKKNFNSVVCLAHFDLSRLSLNSMQCFRLGALLNTKLRSDRE